MLRYVTYDSRYLLGNYDYKVRTETKLMRVLPLRQQSFSPASFHSEESMTRSAKGVKKVLRTSSPCYRCTTAVAKFAAVTAIFLLLSEICDRKKLF